MAPIFMGIANNFISALYKKAKKKMIVKNIM